MVMQTKNQSGSKAFSLSNGVLLIVFLMPLAYLVYANFIREVPKALPNEPQPSGKAENSSQSISFLSAIEAAEKAAQAHPSYQSFLNLGLVYYQSGMYEKSIEATQKAIDLDPNQAVAYNNIAAAYGALEKWDFEIAACEKALQLDSHFQLAKNNLEWAKSQKANQKK